eukprot:gene6704-biopygen2827
MVDEPADAPRDLCDDLEPLSSRVVQYVIDAAGPDPLGARPQPSRKLLGDQGNLEFVHLAEELEGVVAIPPLRARGSVEDRRVKDVEVPQHYFRPAVRAQGGAERPGRVRPALIGTMPPLRHRSAHRIAPRELEARGGAGARGGTREGGVHCEHVVVLARCPCEGHRVMDEGADPLLRAPPGDGPDHAPWPPAESRVRLPRATADEEEDA